MSTKRIHFVTDSTCDLPAEIIKQHPIWVVPCFVNYDGKSYADDGVELVRDSYYREMPKIRPLATTSAPPPALAERIINQAWEGCDHLFIMTLPHKLSATANAMRMGSQHLPPERLTLQTQTLALNLGWQVLLAAETAAATGSVEAVLDAIARVSTNQRLYGALATMEYLRHSGRVNWTQASLGALLQIKPIIEVRGEEILSASRVRTFGKAMDELVRLTLAEGPLDRLAILHTDNATGVQELLQRLGDAVPPNPMITTLTPTLGTYIGPGALGVATVKKSWRTA